VASELGEVDERDGLVEFAVVGILARFMVKRGQMPALRPPRRRIGVPW
jgi:hypothetical protein